MGERVTDMEDVRASIEMSCERLLGLYHVLDGLEEDVTGSWKKWYIVEVRQKIQECIVLMSESLDWIK